MGGRGPPTRESYMIQSVQQVLAPNYEESVHHTNSRYVVEGAGKISRMGQMIYHYSIVRSSTE